MHVCIKNFLVMYVCLVSGSIFGNLQRTGKTPLCPVTTVTFLSGLLHNHIDIMYESRKNTCMYLEWTHMSLEHFLRCIDGIIIQGMETSFYQIQIWSPSHQVSLSNGCIKYFWNYGKLLETYQDIKMDCSLTRDLFD